MTTLKTISMYLRAAKTEAEDAGESTDGMASSVSKLRDEILKLTGNKVDIQIDDNTFKSTYQILKELSAVWSDLNDVSQANILEMVGGKRNANVVSALLENFSVAESAIVSSSSAAGSALAENEKYLDSIAGKISIFQANFQTFSNDLINSGLIKAGVELGSILLSILDGLQRIHLLLPLLSASIAMVKGQMNSNALRNILNQIISQKEGLVSQRIASDQLSNSVKALTIKERELLVTELGRAVTNGKITEAEKEQIISTLELTVAEGTLTTTNKGLALSFKSVLASIPVWGWIALGVTTLIEAISWLSSSVGDSSSKLTTLNDELKDIQNETKSIASEYRELASSAEEVIPRFTELSQGVNKFGENVSLTDEEYKEFLSLNNQIAEMFPELNLGFDSNGNAILALSNDVDTLTESLQDLIKAQRDSANEDIANKMPDAIEKIKDVIKEYDNQINKLEKKKSDLEKEYNSTMWISKYSADDKGKVTPYYHQVLNDSILKDIEEAEKMGVKVTKTEVGSVSIYDESGNITGSEPTFDITYTYDTDKITQAYEKQLDELEKQIQLITERKFNTKDVWASLNPIVNAWLQTDFRYAEFDTKMQDIARSMVAGLDFSELGLDTEEEVQKYVEDYIIKPLFNSDTDVKEAFSKLTDLQSKLKNGEITSDEFSASVKSAFDNLFEGMDSDKVEDFKKNLVAGFQAIGFEGSNLEQIINSVANAWAGLKEATDQPLQSLSDSITNLDIISEKFSKLTNLLSEFDKQGYVSAGRLKELQNEFADTPGLDEFILKIGQASNTDELKDSLESLAEQYLDSCDLLNNLNSEYEDFIAAKLEDIGVTNAQEVVNSKELVALAEKYGALVSCADGTYKLIDSKLELNKTNLSKSTKTEIDRLLELAAVTDLNTKCTERLVKIREKKALIDSLQAGADAGNRGDYYQIDRLKYELEMLYEELDKEQITIDLSKVEIVPPKIDFSSSASSSASSAASTAKEETKSIIDWIEIAIERAKAVVSSAQEVFSNTFKTITDRLSGSKDAIKAINKEISVQEKAYKRYLKEANSVGLSDSLAKKVRNGAIDIKEYSSETQKLIEDYQKWYEKSVECKNAIDELNKSLSELSKQRFDTVASYYDNTLSQITHEKNMINEEISQAEAKGYILSEKYYEALIKNEKENASELKVERKALIEELNAAMSKSPEDGGIEEYSEAWYEMKSKINDVTLAIEQSNTAIIEYGNTIRDLKWDAFDLLHNRISQITDESEFLIELLDNKKLYDDKGQLTSEGIAKMGLLGLNYNTYMEDADKYAKELLDIEHQLYVTPYDQELIKRKQELLELQRKSILGAESEKQAIVDMVEEGINLELQSLQDLIDTYTDALDSAKDLYEYQNKIESQTKNIASIEKQLSAYSGFDDEETKAKVQQLKVDLEEAQKDLQETQYEHYINDQKKLLDDLYSEYETILNSRLDDIDSLILDMIDDINENGDTINEILHLLSESSGYKLSEVMNYIWNGEFHKAANILSAYGENTNDVTAVNDTIRILTEQLLKMIEYLKDDANKNLNSNNRNNNHNSTTKQSGSLDKLPLSSGGVISLKSFSNSIWGSQNILPNRINDGLEVDKFNTPISQTNKNEYTQHFENIVFSMPNVKNYDEMLTSLQRDKNFERLINAMTSDAYMGKSSLAKTKAIR